MTRIGDRDGARAPVRDPRRWLAAAEAVDPGVVLSVEDAKGGKDWPSSEAVAEWYGSGIRRAVLERLVQVLDELTAETHRRHEALRRMPRRDGRGVRPKPRT